MWSGRTVVVAGAGPSLTAAQVETIRAGGVPAVVVNRTHELMPWADWLHAGDAVFWKAHPGAKHFSGIKTTVAPKAAVDGVRYLKSTGLTGFDPDPRCVRSGGNSGYQAVCAAVHAGAARIVLVGFDSKPEVTQVTTSSGKVVERKRLHWHDAHVSPCANPAPNTFRNWRDTFSTLAKALAKRGGPEVVNASPGSAINAWPMMDLEEALVA